jgi:uncharacterized Zn-binding protein involved in type VI secretion
MGRAVTFIGALDNFHCGLPFRGAIGSTNVKVGGIGISRQGDFNTPHLKPGLPCPDHVAPIAIGSLKVKVNGRGCGRIGDSIAGCTSVAQGYPKVFAG